MNHQTMDHCSLFLFGVWNFSFHCAIILPSPGLLLSLECIKLSIFLYTAVFCWLSEFLLHAWERVEDSGDLCQPQNLTCEETCGSLNFKTVAHLNYFLYFILNLTGALFPKLLLKYAVSFQQRFHILLVTCSVTVVWEVTTLLRLHCCVACGTFSSFNCGKNIYYYCS